MDKIKKINFSTFNRRPFWISLIGGFIMAFFQTTGIGQGVFPHFHLNNPFNIQSASTIFETKIEPLLEKKPNTFSLNDSSSNAPQAYAAADYDNASAYALFDLDTGDVLAEKNDTKHVPIASLTKIMTAVVALDLAQPDEKFTITQDAADQIPTKIGIVPGQKMRLGELMEAALMTSANDAAQEIHDGIDAKYGSPIFVEAMNRKAEFLGLQDTHFTNSEGFDNTQHYSSAHDLAVLAHYALQNYPLIAKIAQQDYVYLPANSDHKQFDLYNWNGLLDVYPGAIGLKIGNTENAGYTSVVIAKRQDKTLGVVLLGAPGIIQRDEWAAELLDLGFQKTLGLAPVDVTQQQLQAKYATWQYWN